jgi:hypothetical protein
MLAHAFTRLALHRVALTVFEFNSRAIRSYEKCGFVVEGRARQAIFRDGRFWDEIHMSVLLEEWEARQRGAERAGCGRFPPAGPRAEASPTPALLGGRGAALLGLVGVDDAPSVADAEPLQDRAPSAAKKTSWTPHSPS